MTRSSSVRVPTDCRRRSSWLVPDSPCSCARPMRRSAEALAPSSSPCPVSCTTCAPPFIRWPSASPFFRSLPLAQHGLEWIQPPLPLVHPLDDGPPAILERGVKSDGAASLNPDSSAYRRLIGPLVRHWDRIDSGDHGPAAAHPIQPHRARPLRSASALARGHPRQDRLPRRPRPGSL